MTPGASIHRWRSRLAILVLIYNLLHLLSLYITLCVFISCPYFFYTLRNRAIRDRYPGQ